MGEVKLVKFDSCYDFAFVELTEPDVTMDSKVYSDISLTNYDRIVDKKYVNQLNNGDIVIKVGYKTGVTQGEIVKRVKVKGCNFRNMVLATYPSDHGDSGGFVGSVKKEYHPEYPKDMYVFGIHVGRFPDDQNYRIFIPIDFLQLYGIFVEFN